MSDALEKARDALLRAFPIDRQLYALADFIDAKVNAILDAREAKAEPAPGVVNTVPCWPMKIQPDEDWTPYGYASNALRNANARIAELERENAWLIECNGRASVRAERAEDNEEVSLRLRDQAQADAAKFLERANDLEGKYDALLTTWTESRERHLTAEAALAELRGRVEKAVEKLQWDIDHPATMGHDRGEIIAVLTHPTTPDALLTDPVPATLEVVFSALPSSIIDKFVRELNSWGDQCCGGAGDAINPVNGLPYGHVFYSAASALETARAAGITGKGTSDD